MKQVALTFDDGPDVTTTPKILKLLSEYRAKASFMVWGQHAVKYPELVLDIQHAGHAVGNHSFTHQSLVGLTDQEVTAELRKTDKVLEEIIGQTATFYRPPYGDINHHIAQLVDSAAVIWSLDSEDWKTKEKTAIVTRVENNVKDGDIILMHDLQEATILALRELLPFFERNGYQLITIHQMIGSILAHHVYYSRDKVINSIGKD